eukprot:scaffold40101_cov55-Phaeocystis_antarctica.AAC.1
MKPKAVVIRVRRYPRFHGAAAEIDPFSAETHKKARAGGAARIEEARLRGVPRGERWRVAAGPLFCCHATCN